MGHATAIDLLYDMVNSELTISKIKQLHKAVQTDIIFDIDKPYGDFKVVPNGTYLLLDNSLNEKSKVYHPYSRPFDVSKLMLGFVEYIESHKPHNIDEAITMYATAHLIFGQIHPFWGGNGRIARLIANLILLRAGFAPLVIPATRRLDISPFFLNIVLSMKHLVLGNLYITVETSLTFSLIFAKNVTKIR